VSHCGSTNLFLELDMLSRKTLVKALVVACMGLVLSSSQAIAFDPPPDCGHCWPECEPVACAFDVRCSITNYACGTCDAENYDIQCAVIH